jgi:CrcB protein
VLDNYKKPYFTLIAIIAKMDKMRFFYILLGGFFGSALREILSQFFPGAAGTLMVNLLGSFILGYLMYATELGFFSERERYIGGIGFCGGLTTFSTFMVQTLQFPVFLATGNLLVNVILGLLAVFMGRALAMKELNV